MRNGFLLETCKPVLNDKDHSFLTYSSLVEEAVRIAERARYEEKKILVVRENSFMASRLREVLLSYFEEEEVVSYLPEESLRAEEIATSFENRADRLYALYQILTDERVKVVVMSPYGFTRHLPSKEELVNSIIHIHKDMTLDRDELVTSLRKMGYEKVSHVERPMTYAVRGYIVDVSSVHLDHPVRIEFFDDIVDSIRLFDINTQRTVEEIEESDIVFAKDVFFSEEEKKILEEKVEILSGEMEVNLRYLFEDVFLQSQYFYYAYFTKSHIADYFDDPLVYLSDEEKIREHLHILTDESVSYIQEMHEERKLPLRFHVFGELDRLLAGKRILRGKPFGEMTPFEEIDLPYGNIDYLLTVIQKEKSQKKLFILPEKEMETLIGALVTADLPYTIVTKEIPEGIGIAYGYFYGGFEIPSLSLSVYSVKELFRERIRRGRFANRYAEAVNLNSYEELKPGDYVVHDQYGIGQYVAIEKRRVNGIDSDYLRIVYKGNDELLVPLSRFSLVRKYVSREGVVPKLHKLGTKEWERTKQKVEESVNDVAERLMELYAARESNIGFAFSKDTDLQREFEATFDFDLTRDQIVATEEVKRDMESEKPMDRLLCGDVGFGKTEVALRAAFKAANDNKQTAYLCPTTVLSLQHYNTFKKRLEDFPARVELLNRYVPPNKQKEILRDLKEGRVDILIGTHRILSKDVQYKDLGLLIIDEEQRFGVEHKEKIKEMKNTIDVLSLSATPIPRTLQMSLIGIRGLSTLNTAPQNRYPVQTYVVHKSDNLISEVVLRELERGGQVFYLYNNVDRIYAQARKLRDRIPYARIDVAHGQMSREEIEDVMMRFYQNETDVLLCTTIIETGLDIPNANTIIIDNAQNFGLSQLYQIKGRVGRSDRVAYAYLLIPEKKQLSESSLKRLEAIKEFTSLGSGYKIAMRDLTIRGAGDLLGARQSGFIENVGLDLYLSMLNKAIRIKKGEEVEEEKTATVNIPISSYIPETFSDNDYEKLRLYHELDEINDKEALLDYYSRISDEYGRLPKEVRSLFDKKRLELFVNLALIDQVINRDGRFTIILSKDYSDKIDGLKLFGYCNDLSRDIMIRYRNSRLEISLDNRPESIRIMMELIDHLDGLEKNEDR